MRLIGLDPSMTSTGVAVHIPGAETFTLSIGEKGKTTDTLQMRYDRQVRTADAVLDLVRGADAVAVEAHSFSTKSAFAHDLSGQWWRMVGGILDEGIPVVELEVQRLKGYLTENGNASKEQMLIAAVRRYPTVNIKTNDEADAITALSMLVRAFELAPLEPHWNKRMELEMSKVNWDAIHGST